MKTAGFAGVFFFHLLSAGLKKALESFAERNVYIKLSIA